LVLARRLRGWSCVMAEIDLAFIARQLERLVNDMAGLRTTWWW
jgi:hypothetical protein